MRISSPSASTSAASALPNQRSAPKSRRSAPTARSFVIPRLLALQTHGFPTLRPAFTRRTAPQQSGPVAWDAPNRLLIWGWTPTHIWATQLSYFFEYRTGYPFSVINLQQQLVGTPNSSRFPAYISLNLGIEKKFEFRGYLWSVRLKVITIFGRQNPDTVVNNIDAPNFGAF